jgi:hypothetical protein
MGASNPVSPFPPNKQTPKPKANPTQQLDRFVGLAMLILASAVFAYYTVWTLLMVLSNYSPTLPDQC